jgi:hypothetical protein
MEVQHQASAALKSRINVRETGSIANQKYPGHPRMSSEDEKHIGQAF